MVDRRRRLLAARASTLLFVALFLMGVHSTLFGPVKYAILPQHLQPTRSSSAATAWSRWARSSRSCSARSLGGLAGRDPGRRPGARRRRWRSPSRSPAGCVEPLRSRVRRAVDPISRSTGTRSPRPGATCAFARAQPHRSSCRCSASRGSGSTARSFLAQFPDFAQRRAGRRRARRHAAARGVLGRHRRRLAAVRAAVGPQGRDRPRAVRLDRPDACSRSTCGSRARGMHAHRRSAASARVPARARRTGASLADLVLIGVFGGFYIVPLYALIQERSDAVAPLAHHRRQQHPERAVHGRRGGARDRAARRPG